MNSVEALTRFEKIIKLQPQFCSNELNWIDKRKEDWRADRIRVGVVGVTSSGKSTLINAILGADILSSAVAPSSGQLVCCSYGDTPKIVVHFDDGHYKIFEGDDYNTNTLAQYSDERFNPKNQKNVLSIELTSPMFDLGKDVLLVDSPGLDAFGLEAHEQLTLESLVPTIDACIYVTTMKTNSDRKTQEILSTVGRYHCPIIIVQNMLDAVRPSPSGDKSREQVAHDHWIRMKRIVDNSAIEDKSEVQIIQLSAEYAKQWRSAKGQGSQPKITKEDFEKSHYTSFVHGVGRILELQRPRIEYQRFNSIQNCALELIDLISGKINQPVAPISDKFPLESLKSQTQQHEKKITAAIDQIFQEYDDKVEKILQIASPNDSHHSSKNTGSIISNLISNFTSRLINGRSLDSLLLDTNNTVKQLASNLTSLVSAHNSFVKRTAETLHIPDRDIFSPITLHSFRDIAVEKKTERVSHLVKDSGVGGFFKRIWGAIADNDCGYHREYSDKVVVDEEKTIENIINRLVQAREKYAVTMNNWCQKTFQKSLDAIYSVINEEEDSYNRKKEIIVEAESLSKLGSSLKQFVSIIKENLPSSPHADISEVDKGYSSTLKSVNVSSYTGSILSLSRYALRQQHQCTALALAEQINCKNHTPIVISWDENSTHDFLWQTGLKTPEILQAPTNIPRGTRRCLFILVNTTQYGAALKQIAALRLNSSLTKNDIVIWIVQDFQELLNSGCAAEGLTRMGELSRALEIPCKSTIWLLHDNPIYNLAFLKFQFNDEYRQNLHELIRELQTKYRVYTSETIERQLGEILRAVHIQGR